MAIEQFPSEQVSSSEVGQRFEGDSWTIENAKEEALHVGEAIEMRLLEQGWSEGEINKFGGAVSKVMEHIDKASVELVITKDKAEIIISSKDNAHFDLNPDEDQILMSSIVDETDGAEFALDRVVMWKERKEEIGNAAKEVRDAAL
jgi:hypothetical protein